MSAISPLNATVKLVKVCKKCAITLKDHEFPTDLIVLSIREFNVILRIDWLTKYRANLDCVSRSIFFALSRDLAFSFQFSPLANAFFTTYIVMIEGTSTKVTVAQILIVCELEDVF